jgi:Mg-chelatase subunit ChlD
LCQGQVRTRLSGPRGSALAKEAGNSLKGPSARLLRKDLLIMKRTSLLSLVGLSLAMFACGASDESSGSFGASRSAEPPTSSDTGGTSSSGSAAAPPSTTPAAPKAEPAATTPAPSGAGVLTAGVWDDNRNLDMFLSFSAKQYATQRTGLLPFTDQDYRAAKLKFGQAAPKQRLDIALILDATGSMGDEIRYLQKEFSALTSSIAQRFPNADQRWSLVVYRDHGDQFVTRWYDFRSDLNEYRQKLAEQGAGGGGDIPEALDEGLDKATQLAWGGDDTAKLAFLVADAPHHNVVASKVATAIRSMSDKGVHLYPVASSGVDEFTELTLRQSAQLTGGRYIFLTDDSGVGNSHKEPSIPCYFVTKLDKAISRMVDIEMTGQYKEPEAGDVLRTGGNPQSGACQLADNRTAIAY